MGWGRAVCLWADSGRVSWPPGPVFKGLMRSVDQKAQRRCVCFFLFRVLALFRREGVPGHSASSRASRRSSSLVTERPPRCNRSLASAQPESKWSRRPRLTPDRHAADAADKRTVSGAGNHRASVTVSTASSPASTLAHSAPDRATRPPSETGKVCQETDGVQVAAPGGGEAGPDAVVASHRLPGASTPGLSKPPDPESARRVAGELLFCTDGVLDRAGADGVPAGVSERAGSCSGGQGVRGNAEERTGLEQRQGDETEPVMSGAGKGTRAAGDGAGDPGDVSAVDNDCDDPDSAYVTAMEQIWAEAEAWVDAEAQVR